MLTALTKPERERLIRLRGLAISRFSQKLTRGEESIIQNSIGSQLGIRVSASARRFPVRPDFLRWLLSDADAAGCVSSMGYRIFNCTINGALDLAAYRIPVPLHFVQCTAEGQILLLAATVKSLWFSEAVLNGGISGDGLTVEGPFACNQSDIRGPVGLLGLTADRNVEFRATIIRERGRALSMDGADVRGSVFLSGGFQTDGEVRMLNAKIGGDFGCTSARFTSKERALSLDKLVVRGGMALRDGFECDGSVIMQGASVNGDIDCTGAIFSSSNQPLDLSSSDIKGHLYLKNGFRSSGLISLHSSRVGGTLDCSGAVLSGKDFSFTMEEATIGGTVYLTQGFSALGIVALKNTRIGVNLTCDDCRMKALYCHNVDVKADFIWTDVKSPSETSLWLNGTTCGALRDEKKSWPSQGNLHIDGLRYGDLMAHGPKSDKERKSNSLAIKQPISVLERIEWLELQPTYERAERQPWYELVDLLRRRGDEPGGRRVIFAYQSAQVRHRRWYLRWSTLAMARLQRQLFLILLVVLVITAASGTLFKLAFADGGMAPTGTEAHSNWVKTAMVPDSYPEFQPFVYALENSLPLVKFGVEDKWAPDHGHHSRHLLESYRTLVWVKDSLIIFGWFEASILAAALARRFKS